MSQNRCMISISRLVEWNRCVKPKYVGFTYFWQSIHISDIIISFSIEKLYVVGVCTLSKTSHCNPTLLQDNFFLFLVASSLRVFILFFPPFMPLVLFIWTFGKSILGHVRTFSHVRTLFLYISFFFFKFPVTKISILILLCTSSFPFCLQVSIILLSVTNIMLDF